jgi:prolyl oligopeptidase
MLRRWLMLGLCGAALAAPAQADEDPYLYLEEVQGERALAWVRGQQQAVEQTLQARPRHAALEQGFRELLASPQRLAPAQQLSQQAGAQLYNFWRDEAHPRGLWRRTTLASYRSAAPQWQTVLDLDRLAEEEGERWVWGGASCLPPQARRCLISLSRGGGDAHVLREFDTVSGRFVVGGFSLPEAKGGASWVDADTLSVYTDFGPGSMTASGFPRQVRLWQRGTPLAQARLLFEAAAEDIGVWTWADDAPGRGSHVIERRTSFFAGEQYLLRAGRLVKLPKPDDASATPFGDQLLIELRSDWETGGQRHLAGSLLAIGQRELLAGSRRFQTLFRPSATSALQSHTALRSAVLLLRMDDVQQHLSEWRYLHGRWRERQLPGVGLDSLGVSALAGQHSDRYLLTRSGFLTPATLELAEAGRNARQRLQQLPAFFDASTHEVAQWHARSADGTLVPYFIVKPRGAQAPAGGWPTLLYGYGGFEISMKPGYSGILGRGWLSQGGVYVLANLRGGGEFGPRWHQAALREQRQRSFDDFIAVAEDLIARGITQPQRLGIMGGSLGGLLTSVALVQRPELFGAVVSQVPLTDMQRYHRLLAGASWIEEYGNPDLPEQWAYISKYSPYQNSRAGVVYPKVLYTSSTRDDRVHPGHARKMVARLQAQGHEALYWENMEGGHAGAASIEQQARLWALSYGFLAEQLMR